MKKFAFLGGILSIMLSGFVVVLAQQTQTPTTTAATIEQGRRDRASRRMMMGRRMRARAIRELDLTDAQKQQAQALRRENFERNRATREELAQLLQKRRQGSLTDADQTRARELRQQLQQSRRNTHSQIARLLTEEQRTKLQEMRQEIRKNRRENRERFRERGLNRPI